MICTHSKSVYLYNIILIDGCCAGLNCVFYYETLSNDVSQVVRQEGTVHLNFTAFNRSVVPCISNTSKNPYSTQTNLQFSIPAR